MEKKIEIIDTNKTVEEVGPGTPVCIAICVAGCGTTSGFGTLGSVVAGTAIA